jgi:uncharacterized protein (UPF0147 family)
MVDVTQIVGMLDQIIADRSVPKNIRKVAEDSKAVLTNDKQSDELKISTAIHNLDEITNDPNMPLYTRTLIWNVVSMLEQIRRDMK